MSDQIVIDKRVLIAIAIFSIVAISAFVIAPSVMSGRPPTITQSNTTQIYISPTAQQINQGQYVDVNLSKPAKITLTVWYQDDETPGTRLYIYYYGMMHIGAVSIPGIANSFSFSTYEFTAPGNFKIGVPTDEYSGILFWYSAEFQDQP